MSFNLTPSLKNHEDARAKALVSAVKLLERHLFQFTPTEIIATKIKKQTFWLMNSLVTYNTRRAKLFKKILQTDLTEDEWIEFTTHITAVENKIVDAINKGHVDNECINFLKNNFWFIDGFIRHKLKYCKMFMIQNDIECSDISESDIEIDSKDLGNPLFQGCTEEKFNKDSIQKVFGSKVVNSLDQEVFDEISLDCQSLDDLKTIVVPHVPGYIAKDIDFNAKINEATGLDNVSIEVKSSNPFTTNEKKFRVSPKPKLKVSKGKIVYMSGLPSSVTGQDP